MIIRHPLTVLTLAALVMAGGAALAVFGGITLLLHVPAWSESVQTSLIANQLLLPLIVTVAVSVMSRSS